MGLSRMGASFSEANLKVLKEDENARRYMSQRYSEVMGSTSSAPEVSMKTRRQSGQRPAQRKSAEGLSIPSWLQVPAEGTLPVNPGAWCYPTPSRTEVPKSELRRTMTGAAIVVLPNSRRQVSGGELDIHSPSPKRHGKSKPTRSMDYSGEMILM
ncbi:unnamed protein product [Polarella glacialis]|uniref:Uncharacterized protein n=1 Tax=Polarella glacialis TaxID=89957 RepID=A0A813LV63_POLGL|nr:unnamed protein product [Polarella glacialis]